MKVFIADFKKGFVRFLVTSPEDAWHLSQLIEEGDHLRGKTTRKVTLGSADAKTTHVTRIVTLEIVVERIEYEGSDVRVSGKITDAPEDMPRGSYHTLQMELHQEYTLTKEEWLSHHKNYLKEATKVSEAILICVFDRDEAFIALTQQWGIETLNILKGNPQKKELRAQSSGSLYKDIAEQLARYNERFAPQFIIVASPAFYKNEVAALVSADIKKKLIIATCNSVQENALQEVLQRPETQAALRNNRVAVEHALVEKLLTIIAKNGAATYGFSHVKAAADAGAVEELLITTKLIKERQQKKTFADIASLMKNVDSMKGTIHVISAEHEAGKKLQGLGGIAALLRYKLE